MPDPPSTLVSGQTGHQNSRETKDKWLELLKRRLGTFLLTALVALLTVFSQSITEKIKFALDRADARQEKLAKLSDDLGIFLFDCELEQEDLAEGATKRDLMADAGGELNAAISSLRDSEYSNRAMITTYWSAEKAQEFERIMGDIKNLEPRFRELNSQLRDQTTDKFTPEVANRASCEIKAQLDPLRNEVSDFLLKMQ